MQENEIKPCPKCGRRAATRKLISRGLGARCSHFYLVNENDNFCELSGISFIPIDEWQALERGETPLEKITKERDELLKLAEGFAEDASNIIEEWKKSNCIVSMNLIRWIDTRIQTFHSKYPPQP